MTKNKQTTSSRDILTAIASLKLTVVCLVILTVLVVWGTVYQAENGLYQAQEKFFHSWFFLLFGIIPFPGTILVMFVLFVNLVFSLYYRIGFQWRNIGNIITHTGILILLLGGFLTFYFSQESSLMLREGETSSLSSSRQQWEVAIWQDSSGSGESDVYAIDTGRVSTGEIIPLDDLGVRLEVKEYYDNCTPFTTKAPSSSPKVINASGIGVLKYKPDALEVVENVAGGVFDVSAGSAPAATVLLYGQEDRPTTVTLGDKRFYFSLRRQKIPLPLEMTLLDFKLKMYPNSQIPKSYSSRVNIKGDGGVEREVVISMNKPLRYSDYTFFQSRYYIAPNGTEYTILAVVKNASRLLPYISSITIFTGMMIHFLVMLFRRRNKTAVEPEEN